MRNGPLLDFGYDYVKDQMKKIVPVEMREEIKKLRGPDDGMKTLEPRKIRMQ
jgi:hypothetical protein